MGENVAAATAVVLASDVQTTSFTYTIPSNLEGEYTVRFVWRSSSNCADLVIAPRPLPVGAPPGSTWTSDNNNNDDDFEAPAANLAAPSSTKSSKPSRGQLSVSGTY